MKFFRKPRFLWVYPLAIWLFATANTSETSLRIGIVLVALGELVRLWANGYVGHVKVNSTQQWLNQPKIGHLITAGPYAYVRNPLYVGTFLIGFGFCVVVRDLFVALGALLFFAAIYDQKAKREEETILNEWGKDYEAYRQAVPRWLPTLKPYPSRVRYGQWSWQGINASKELKTVIWVLATLLALYFREEFWQNREAFATKHVFLGLLFFALIATDGICELLKRAKRGSAVASGPAV